MIKEFESQKDYQKFVLKKTKRRKVGWGAEGTCYLGDDNLVYKIIDIYKMYTPKGIITNDDYNLSHFAFPIDVFTNLEHNVVFGYNAKFLNNDMFRDCGDDLEDINLDVLVENYYDMLEEVKILSNDNILMYDLLRNLLFNNKFLLAIDTLYYHTIDENTFELNNDILLTSITVPLNIYFGLRVNVQDVKSIEDLANKVKKRVKEKKSNYISY